MASCSVMARSGVGRGGGTWAAATAGAATSRAPATTRRARRQRAARRPAAVASSPCPPSLVSQRLDRIQRRRLARRIEAEEHADRGGEADGDHHRA